jgi:predicted Fe-Mo cluster-binding NifX family protein
MKIAVASKGPDWADEMADVFGRCPYLLFFDTESGATTCLENPGRAATGGAGIQAAQFVLDRKTEVLVTPKIGPKAEEVLDTAGVRIVVRKGGTAGGALGIARREAPV